MDSVAQIADEVNAPLDTDEYAALGDLLGGLDSLTEHENAGQSYLLAKGPRGWWQFWTYQEIRFCLALGSAEGYKLPF